MERNHAPLEGSADHEEFKVTITRELQTDPDPVALATLIGEMTSEMLVSTAPKWYRDPAKSTGRFQFSIGALDVMFDEVEGHYALSVTWIL